MKVCWRKIRVYWLLFIVYWLLVNKAFGDSPQQRGTVPFVQVPSVIHVHSNFSDGKYSIEEIAQIASEKGIKVVIFSDHDLMRWEYGLWPLRNILKKRIEKNSVLKLGTKKYFQEIEKVQKKYPEILFLPGVESAPFYYWSGKHFKYHLTLHNWHKHILVTGLNNHKDYENLPLVSNPNAGARNLRSIILLWPIWLLVTGYWLLVKKRKRQLIFGDQVLITYSPAHKILGVIVILFGFLFLINNYPYKYFPFDQYHGDGGIEPYQNLINYMNDRGGVIFWAHPEAPNWEKPVTTDYTDESRRITPMEGPIKVQTSPYPEDLLKTKNYTGYAILYEGYKKIGTPGGIWDQILSQYCQGIREKPIWAIGELDYKFEGYLGTYLDSIQNILLIPTNLHKSEQESQINTNIIEVLDCLRKGKFYVLQKAKNWKFILEKFEVETEMGKATIGEEIKCSNSPKIKIGIKSEIETKIKTEVEDKHLLPLTGMVKVKLIRAGETIKIFEQKLPFEIEYIDSDIPVGKTYYRLDITGPQGEKIFPNPIFVIK